jgi:hypothetical protein
MITFQHFAVKTLDISELTILYFKMDNSIIRALSSRCHPCGLTKMVLRGGGAFDRYTGLRHDLCCLGQLIY